MTEDCAGSIIRPIALGLNTSNPIAGGGIFLKEKMAQPESRHAETTIKEDPTVQSSLYQEVLAERCIKRRDLRAAALRGRADVTTYIYSPQPGMY